MKINLTEFIPGPDYNFKTGHGLFLNSKNISFPTLFHITYIRNLWQEKRLRYEISYTLADFHMIKLMEDKNQKTSIKVKLAWEKLKIQEKIFPIYVNYLNRFLVR